MIPAQESVQLFGRSGIGRQRGLEQKCPQLRDQNSDTMVRSVKNNLMHTAETLGGQRTPHDNAYGYGLLRADQLVQSFNCG